MAIEAVAAIAAKELSIEAVKEAAVQAAREIAQKMAAEAGGHGGRELQTAMMERQTLQESFRIGEIPDTKEEGREVLKQKESAAADEIRKKIDAEESSFNDDGKETGLHQEGTSENEICNCAESEQTDAKWDDCRCDETKNGKPVYEVESGRDSELLNGKLPEKSVLEIDNPVGKNHIQIETNGMGRNVDMKVDRLERIPGELRVRDEYQQRRCRQMKDGRPGDDGGHLLANEFGGPKEQVNLSPMNSYINRHGEWRRMEKFVEKSIDGGKTVTDYRVKSTYDGESLRPEKFTVSMKADGVPKYFQIKNPITNTAMVA